MDTGVPANLLAVSLTTAASLLTPLLVAILVTGLLISIFQVATQIQEMTLTFVPKLMITGAVLFVLGGWMLQQLGALAILCLDTASRPW